MSEINRKRFSKEEIAAFAKENWPLMAAVTGAGSAILLLIMWYRKNHQYDEQTEQQLDELGQEAATGLLDFTTLLETGGHLGDVVPGVPDVAFGMAAAASSEKDRDTMLALAGITEKNGAMKKKRRFWR